MGQRIQLSENQLRKLIRESVRKALVNEDMFYGGKGLEGDDVIFVNPTTFRKIMSNIKRGDYDEIITEWLDNVLEGDVEWFEEHIDVSAQNIDVASDIYYEIKDALMKRAEMFDSQRENEYN